MHKFHWYTNRRGMLTEYTCATQTLEATKA